MRDNRQILSDAGSGAEVNTIVKRIILNMEDKIMVLERKMDLILESPAANAAANNITSAGAHCRQFHMLIVSPQGRRLQNHHPPRLPLHFLPRCHHPLLRIPQSRPRMSR